MDERGRRGGLQVYVMEKQRADARLNRRLRQEPTVHYSTSVDPHGHPSEQMGRRGTNAPARRPLAAVTLAPRSDFLSRSSCTFPKKAFMPALSHKATAEGLVSNFQG